MRRHFCLAPWAAGRDRTGSLGNFVLELFRLNGIGCFRSQRKTCSALSLGGNSGQKTFSIQPPRTIMVWRLRLRTEGSIVALAYPSGGLPRRHRLGTAGFKAEGSPAFPYVLPVTLPCLASRSEISGVSFGSVMAVDMRHHDRLPRNLLARDPSRWSFKNQGRGMRNPFRSVRNCQGRATA